MSERDFFSILRNKLKRTPDRSFDASFWRRFDREFPSKPIWKSWTVWVPAAAFAMLIAVVISHFHSTEDQMGMQVMEQSAMLEDFDLFVTFDDLPVTDEDWDYLLEPKES